MSSKRRRRRLAAGAGVVLATSGLTSCVDNGAVDPPPPPFACDGHVARGGTLTASGVVSGRELRITIQNAGQSQWTEVGVVEVTGGVAQPVNPGEPLIVVIDLAEGTTNGSFTLTGTLQGTTSVGTCRVTRTFTFRVGSDGVVVARQELPLDERQPARIALVRREGLEVQLELASPCPAGSVVRWTVSGGHVPSDESPRLRWRLPSQPGVYQAEVVVDHGRRGLSFDALALAVESERPDEGGGSA